MGYLDFYNNIYYTNLRMRNTNGWIYLYLKEISFIKRFDTRTTGRNGGVRRETIMRLEAGKYNPSLKLAIDISKAVNTPIEELFIFK